MGVFSQPSIFSASASIILQVLFFDEFYCVIALSVMLDEGRHFDWVVRSFFFGEECFEMEI